jgi:hypothetical protein
MPRPPGEIGTRSAYDRSVFRSGRRPMNPGGAPSATLWMRAASGLEVLTGLGLIVAPSLLALLLFGSDLNAAGEATGRIAGLVMV